VLADAVREQAVNPWATLPPSPDVELVAIDGATIAFSPVPMAQVVRIDGTGPFDVAGAVDAARAAARDRDKTILAWWVTPDRDELAGELEARGLRNVDTPGFEAIENAMALVEPPAGDAPAEVDVRIAESWDDYVAMSGVSRSAFGTPVPSADQLRELYEVYRRPDNPGRGFLARVDGRAVGSSYAAFGAAGVNLFGGAVVEDARGRGVYRALVHARWRHAVERGTPALTVQAGKMSRPILERLGFQFVAPVRVYVDEVDGTGG
jgi:GNAT superfamily N-acetyltransferase